jgi:hypothetical protein
MRGFQSSFSAVQATTPTCGGATRTCAAFSLGTATCCARDRFENTVSNVLRVLHYLRGTISRRLFFPRSSSLQLQAYCDATRASDPFDRRSLSAYCIFS